MRAGDHRVLVCQRQIVLHRVLLFAQLRRNRLVVLDGIAHFNPLVLLLLLFELLAFLVEVFFAQPNVPSDHRCLFATRSLRYARNGNNFSSSIIFIRQKIKINHNLSQK